MSSSSGSEHFGEMLFGLMRRDVMPRVADPSGVLAVEHGSHRYSAALLIALCGSRHPSYDDARQVLSGAPYFAEELGRTTSELDQAAAADPQLAAALAAAADVGSVEDAEAAADLVWQVTFPQGVGVAQDWVGSVSRLRQRRHIEIVAPNPNPIVDPIREVLFTSNVLISAGDHADATAYWYDHPIPLDADPANTELAHGLVMLDAAVGFELNRNPSWRGPATVALSVSASQLGNAKVGLEFVRRVVRSVGELSNLRVFAFNETLSERLWAAAVTPADVRVTADGRPPVFGVDGPYGRHYSFLKAVAAFWAVCVDHDVRATFKIDLDQSFPQSRLVAETGASAFEHLTTSRWGGCGRGSDGRALDLVMIAGGLVNEADVHKSVFTPDIQRDRPRSTEDVVFFSRLPQALSTEAEIVARYDSPIFDGVAAALERVHVTGGTTGITVAGLRRWRLFTPSAFGRAEDQAYVLSAIATKRERPAYVHEPGLIMRHDKAFLIPGIIDEGAASKHIGDLVRIKLFSSYVDDADRDRLEPFTGSFVSRIPRTVVAMRFAIRALEMSGDAMEQYVASGVGRLRNADATASGLHDHVAWERAQWDGFYDALDRLEAGLGSRDRWALDAVALAKRIVSEAEITGG